MNVNFTQEFEKYLVSDPYKLDETLLTAESFQKFSAIEKFLFLYQWSREELYMELNGLNGTGHVKRKMEEFKYSD